MAGEWCTPAYLRRSRSFHGVEGSGGQTAFGASPSCPLHPGVLGLRTQHLPFLTLHPFRWQSVAWEALCPPSLSIPAERSVRKAMNPSSPARRKGNLAYVPHRSLSSHVVHGSFLGNSARRRGVASFSVCPFRFYFGKPAEVPEGIGWQ